MLECHQIQRQAISEAKNLDSIISGGKNIGEFAMELEVESTKWIVSFSSWISSQRNFVKSLNGWLALCLNYEPKETPDGIPPYSPGRIGAPPVFVICNSWSQAMDMISEKEVVDSMQALASNLRHLWEQQNIEQQERIMAIREMDRWVKVMERNTQEIHKEVEALNKKLALVPGQSSLPVYSHLYGVHGHEASSLEVSLRHAFEALESFSARSLQAYEDLYSHAEEERVGRENAKVP